MTAVANPPSFQQISRPWGASGGQGGLNAMNPDEVARMFTQRKSLQRANSSSSITSTSSGSSTATATIPQTTTQANGVSIPVVGDLGSWTSATRKKPPRTGPWPMNKAEPIAGVTTARPQPILSTNGASATSTISSMQQPSVLPSQHLLQSSQQNGARQPPPANGEGQPVLYLLSMNGTFERKTISVPFYPESLRIGRQTNAKTVPTPTNGFFDSKVLSRQHAEVWADRNGKIWIRDVRSSNGTFVNGARLSAENRDSEPHELQTSDHLELGIDIVSEDQKTVVHHKVAAKVEHAGFLGATNNVLDMNFGDLDPANGALMLPSQNGLQLRGRAGSQGSIGSNGRIGPPSSIAGSNMTGGAQRHMNFWLTPVTTEQIVKRLTHEMRAARVQTHDLGRTENFLETLLSKNEIKEAEKVEKPEDVVRQVPPLVNGGSTSSAKLDGKARFSDPPAPPPQQPLPEKPDVARSQTFDPTSPSLRRSNTERPRSVPNGSPIRSEPTSQIISLVEALAVAKKEIDSQSARMRDLEELLQKEREARETAEGLAKRLELESANAQSNGFTKDVLDGKVIEAAFEPPAEPVSDEGPVTPEPMSPEILENSSTKLQQKLELMMAEMKEMKVQMESYRQRAETAEAESDKDRKSLTEMVEKIRLEEVRRSSSTERARSPQKGASSAAKPTLNGAADSGSTLSPLLHKAGFRNGKATSPAEPSGLDNPLAVALSRPPGSQNQLLYHSTPYASMLGVVLLGMGLMAYMNGWQKVDR